MKEKGKHLILYCGSEGFLSATELRERTEADIAKWAKENPIKYRHYMGTTYREFLKSPENKRYKKKK